MFVRSKKHLLPDSFYVGNTCERKWAELLDEGLFKSFPTSVVKRDVVNLLTGLNFTTSSNPSVPVDFVVTDEDEVGTPDMFNDMNIVVVALDKDIWNQRLESLLNSRLYRDGWYVSDVILNKYTVTVSCEPRYPVENDRIDEFSRMVLNYPRTKDPWDSAPVLSGTANPAVPAVKISSP